MNEFEQRKKDILQPIYFGAGAALFDCQSFEYGIAYLLHLFSRLGTKGLNIDKACAILDGEEKKTAGQLIGMLKKHVDLSVTIENELASALKARNNLVHHFLIDNVERMTKVKEHDSLVAEIRLLRSKVRKSHKQLEPIIASLAALTDGLNLDDFANEVKQDFMRETNASLLAQADHLRRWRSFGIGLATAFASTFGRGERIRGYLRH